MNLPPRARSFLESVENFHEVPGSRSEEAIYRHASGKSGIADAVCDIKHQN